MTAGEMLKKITEISKNNDREAAKAFFKENQNDQHFIANFKYLVGYCDNETIKQIYKTFDWIG